jgi:dipeptidyl aminopeptidase/acylaminoacyl peptidase
VQLTSDGVKDYEWIGRGWRYEAKWSPDGSKLAVTKVDYRKVPPIPIVRYLGPTEDVSWVNPAKDDGLLAQPQLFIIDIVSKERIRVDTGDEADQLIFSLGWRPRGAELLFLRVVREFKQVDLLAAGAETGATRVVLSETQKAFVLEAFFEVWFWERQLGIFILLEDGEKFVWVSERDGWKHLYLYDMNGNLIRRLTEGSYPVIQVVDENAGWVYLTAHGDPQRPYDTHLYRVSLQGKGFTRLTEGTGQHRIEFAPSKQFFLDTHSSVDRPPVVELRRADGAALQMVSEASLEALRDLKWRTPEEFVVKAADGKTDLYGVLYKPYDFDASKKYPVIEVIYGGPWYSEVVRSTFIPQGWSRSALRLAHLGFITFVVDGRGTPERGREFEDVVYGSKGRYLISDHVAALKQLAEKRPYIDLSRVGIFGHSFGGYMALHAILTAPDVYHVAVASAPGLDLSEHWRSDTEPYLGLPEENRELDEYASNLRLAGNLKGKLLLIHGTSDVSVRFSNTMKMVEALIRAEKPFDLLVLPDQPHDIWSARVSGKTYWRERMRRYFQEHLNPE